MPLDTPLSKIIADQIRDGGAISFRDFVELALYHPELGYYNRPQAELGREGDFYTSPQVGPVFGWTMGRAIANQFLKEDYFCGILRSKARGTEPISIVEFGAGKGFLAWDVMEYFKYQHPEWLEQIQYVLVEQSAAFRRHQEKLFGQDPVIRQRIRWTVAEELPKFRGIVLANEFVDALPFHRIVLTREGFREIFVNFNESGFCEILGPLSTPRLEQLVEDVVKDFEKQCGVPWPVGQPMEISVDALDWVASLTQWLERGQVILIDYGDAAGKLHSVPRFQGTVKAFFKHQIHDRLFDHIGEQDLTSDVNFSLLVTAAKNHGFVGCQLTTQADFLQKNEILKVVEDRSQALHLDDETARDARRQILNLILPEMMGTRFKVLTLER